MERCHIQTHFSFLFGTGSGHGLEFTQLSCCYFITGLNSSYQCAMMHGGGCESLMFDVIGYIV